MPFSGFPDFAACSKAMQAKGHSKDASDRICGKLQSKAEGASLLTDEEVISSIKSALDYQECLDQAKENGIDDIDAAKRICDSVAADQDEDIKDKGVDEADEGENPAFRGGSETEEDDLLEA